MSDANESRFPEGKSDSELNMGAIHGTLIATISILVVSMVLVFWMHGSIEDYLARSDDAPALLPEANEQVLPPLPRLQVLPEQDLVEMREGMELLQHSYGWVSKERGKVRIPIEDAMHHVAEHGLPTWPAAPVAIDGQ